MSLWQLVHAAVGRVDDEEVKFAFETAASGGIVSEVQKIVCVPLRCGDLYSLSNTFALQIEGYSKDREYVVHRTLIIISRRNL